MGHDCIFLVEQPQNECQLIDIILDSLLAASVCCHVVVIHICLYPSRGLCLKVGLNSCIRPVRARNASISLGEVSSGQWSRFSEKLFHFIKISLQARTNFSKCEPSKYINSRTGEKRGVKEKSERIQIIFEYPPVRGENVKTFRWDHRLQRQNLFMATNFPWSRANPK